MMKKKQDGICTQHSNSQFTVPEEDAWAWTVIKLEKKREAVKVNKVKR